MVRTLAYLGGFVLVVIASRRAQARPWLGGLAVGLTVVGVIALLARFEPSIFGNPDADLAAGLPVAIGRLTYPIGYWNGLAAAMAAAIVLLCWWGATASGRWTRSASVAAMPPIMLALWMTESRGGIVAALLAFAVLVAAGPARTRLIVNLGFGALAGALLIALAETRAELLDNPLSPLAGAQGDQMLAITAAVVAGTLALRYGLDRWIQPLAISRRAGRGAVVALAIAAVVALVAIDPIERYDEFKAPPSATEFADGEIGLLRGGGSGRYQFWETAVDAFASSPVGRGRRQRLHPVLVRASGDRDPGDPGALAAVRDPGRARDHRLRDGGDVLRRRAGRGREAGTGPGCGRRGRSGAGRARGRVGGLRGRLDLGPSRGLRDRRGRGGAADRTGDAARAGPAVTPSSR